ncbi:MAG: RNA methyltransferase [Clostridia bacterium]|nr:RNA methyltransferase [Clostridia bacterium]
MEKITSCKNLKVIETAKLCHAKERAEKGLFLADGIKLIYEVVKSGYEILTCFVQEGADLSVLPNSVDKDRVIIAGENVMQKISPLTNSQQFIAVCKIKEQTPPDTQDSFILALERIQDPSNAGAILRSAEAFGIKSIVMGHGCCDIYSPKALRAAMGSTFRLNISYVQLREFLTEKVMQGFDIIGTGLDKNYKTVDKLCESEKKVVIIGNEGSGISKEIQDICSIGMYIPMYGENESLNAAVAASIIMWENKRQNNERKPGTLDLA